MQEKKPFLDSTNINTTVTIISTVISIYPFLTSNLSLSDMSGKDWSVTAISLIFALFFLLRERKSRTSGSGQDNTKDVSPKSPADPSQKIDIHRLPEPAAALIGREKELVQITDAFLNKNKAVVGIIAGGGVGKSALIYEWLKQMQPDYDGLKRVFAWSFYSQGSHQTANSSAPFFQAALPFFGYEKELPKDEIEKARELAKRLQQQDMILILDGMEPLQHSPHILGGEIKDAALKEFLRCIKCYGLGNHKSLIIISSRQLIAEYEAWTDAYVKIDLNLLNEKQGADLLKSLKVSGTQSDLEAASRDMGGHALGLVLLGKLLFAEFGGDVRRRDCLNPLKSPQCLEDLQELHLPEAFRREISHTLRVLQYYDNLWLEQGFLKKFYKKLLGKEAPERILLRLIGLFDRPMGLPEKQVLLEKAAYAKPLTEIGGDEFQKMEKRLEHAGLLLKWERGARTEWDCHPIVRTYFGERFRSEAETAYRQAQSVLFEYYQGVPKKKQPDTIEELEPLYRAVVHGCLAGEYRKAMYEVYIERIRRGKENYSTQKLGAFSQDLTAISAFFPKGWEKPVSSGLSEADQAWLLATAAFCLMSLGRLAEAVEPRRGHMQSSEKLEDWEEAAIAAENLVDLLLPIGDLNEAEKAATHGIDFADKTDDLFQKMCSYAKLAATLHRKGNLQESLKKFETAEAIQQKDQPEYPKLYSLAGSPYCALLLDRASDVNEREAVLERGRWAITVEFGRLLDLAFDHLSIALALSALNRPDESLAEFDQAVQGIRKAGTTIFMPEFLIARAAFLRVQKNYDAAKQDIDEARDIIERCGMNLYAVDLALLEANLFIDLKKYEGLEQLYNTAQTLIQATGYHLRDAQLDLLAARLAHYKIAGISSPAHYLDRAKAEIEKIGYYGLMPEWERVRKEIA